MKQESRFVAEVYRYLAPFTDTNQRVFLSLDGIAARKGVTNGVFDHPDVPDSWFSLVDNPEPILLEAKILYAAQKIKLNRTQLSAWRSDGTGTHKPAAWVAANESFTVFYYWLHEQFLPRLNESTAIGRYPELTIPDSRIEFSSVAQLALHILRYAPGAIAARPAVSI